MDVWLLDAGKPGHTVQVIAIGNALERISGTAVACVRCEARVRGAFRKIARGLCDSAPARLARPLARMFYRGLELPPGRPDVVIASCGDSAYLARLIGKFSGAVIVWTDEAKPFPSAWFDLNVVYRPATGAPEISAPLVPNLQTPEKLAEAAAAYWPEKIPEACHTMLIGGTSRTHDFRDSDWETLAGEMNRHARACGVRWLVTTSRRTGPVAEKILRTRLDPACVHEAVWWSENPKKAVSPFLHAAERVFATRDSLTMLSEAISAKGGVDAIHPVLCQPDPAAPATRYIRQLEAAGWLRSMPADRFAEGGPPADPAAVRAAICGFEETLAGLIGKFLSEKPAASGFSGR